MHYILQDTTWLAKPVWQQNWQQLNDSLHTMVTDNIITTGSNEFGTVVSQLDNISVFGIGYSDAATHIAFPLIIALFAFAFPFLYTVISHINNKYQSESITKMLSAEASYRWFMWGAIVCASFLFLAGVFSNCLNDEAYSVLKIVLDWMSVIIAGGYSAIIIWFVFTCVDYNSPHEVLVRIESRFRSDSHPIFRHTIKGETKIYKEEYIRINRYIGLCKFAVNKQDYNLFVDILKHVNELKYKRTNLEGLNYSFYEEVLKSYLFGKPNGTMEDSLMAYWFMTFKQTEVPTLGIIARMFAKVVNAVKQGRPSVFENYLLRSKYGYRFIADLTIKNYVRGASLEEQKIVDEKRRMVWRDLCLIHNMALAHLFSMGYYEVVRIVQLGDNTGYDRLIPGMGIEVLRMFAICKEKQSPDRTYSHWSSEYVIGKNTDPMMMEKYAAIMLMLSSSELHEELRPIAPKHLKIIQDAKENIIKYGMLWKKDAKLKGMFPQIDEVDIKTQIERYIKWFEGENENKESTNGDVDKKCVITRIIDNIRHNDKKSTKKLPQNQDQDIYGKELLDSEKKKIEYGYLNMINGNRGYLLDQLESKKSEDKTEIAEMGVYTYKMFKQHMVESRDTDYNLGLFGETRIFQSRYLYLLMNAIHNMNMNDIVVDSNHVKRHLKELLGDKGNEYMVLDFCSAPLLLLSLDKEDKENYGYNDEKVMKATYKSYSLDNGWFMNGFNETEDFSNTIVVIKKDDLPYVCGISSTGYGPTVDFEDVSDRESGIAEVRVIVNPNLEMKYSKKAKVTRLKVSTLIKAL